MEGGGGKFHAERAAELIQREHVGRVVVADCAAETYILKTHLLQSKECTEPLVKSTGMTAQLVVLAAEPLYRYAYADVGKTACKRYHTILKPSACGYHNPTGVAVALLDNFSKVFADEWLSAGEIYEFQVGQTAQIGRGYLPRVCR